jgi:hypothetical protein
VPDREPGNPTTRNGTGPGPGVYADEQAEVGFEGVTPRQAHAITLLLSEPTVQKAADALGINDRTLFRWLQEPAFAAAYRAARRQAFQQAMGLTHRYVPYAVQTLVKVMADPKSPAGAKVSAAKGLLEFSRESLELDDLAARVDALEQRAKAIDPRDEPIDTTAHEIKDVPPEALPGAPFITEDGVQPDFKADAESFRTRPEKQP